MVLGKPRAADRVRSGLEGGGDGSEVVCESFVSDGDTLGVRGGAGCVLEEREGGLVGRRGVRRRRRGEGKQRAVR